MSNSLESLLERMRQGSVTEGWGAVSVFSRAKLNRLLEQQYIERFQRLAFLPPFMGDIGPDGQQTDTVSLANVELGPPLLSFNTATQTNSRALLSMNMVAGSFITRHKGAGVATTLSSTFSVTEQMGFRLEMDIDLSMVFGEVDWQGKVTLNLADGVNFRCNLAGNDDAVNERLANFFKQEFESLPPHRSVFQLGMLELRGYNPLSPKFFRLITQAAPGAKVRGAKNFADGAVVVFIQLLANDNEGTYPPSRSFPFLIPDDRNADNSDKYSASLILSRDMLPYSENDRLDVLNNLLFPGANAFVEIERHKPHDLAVFGAISPRQTSITLDPQFKTIRAGESQRLTLRDWQGGEIKADSWQAVSLQSHTPEGHGSITDGVYKAVGLDKIGHDTLRVVVTATYSNAGSTYKASALLLVVFDVMQVAPRVAVAAGGSKAAPIVLSASHFADSDDGAVRWTLLGPQYGDLSELPGGALFTPDARAGKKALLAQQVEARGSENRVASLLLVNGQQMLHIEPPHVLGVRKAATVKLQDDTALLSGLERRWRVIGGSGEVDADGVFTPPTNGVSSSSVVSCEVVRNGVVFSSGYSVIELSELVEELSWKELTAFTIKVPGGSDNEKRGGSILMAISNSGFRLKPKLCRLKAGAIR